MILFASKLQPRKNADGSARSLRPPLRHRFQSVPYLIIVGDGEERARLEARARELDPTGFGSPDSKTSPALPRIFALADVFVLPSRHEPWGLIVNEAMACGCPSSSRMKSAPRRSRHHGVEGFVFPAGDIPAFASALARVVSAPNKRDEMRRPPKPASLLGLRADIEASARRSPQSPASSAPEPKASPIRGGSYAASLGILIPKSQTSRMRILHIVGTISPAAGGPTEVIRMLVRFAPPGYSRKSPPWTTPAATVPPRSPLPGPCAGLQSQALVPSGPPEMAAEKPFPLRRSHCAWPVGIYPGFSALLSVLRQPVNVFTHGMLDPWFKRAYPLKHSKKWLYWLVAEYWVLRGAQTRPLHHRTRTRPRPPRASGSRIGTHGRRHRLQDLRPPDTNTPSSPPSMPPTPTFAAPLPPLPGPHRPKKGCDLLVEAFAKLCATDPDLHLVMAGPDPTSWQPTPPTQWPVTRAAPPHPLARHAPSATPNGERSPPARPSSFLAPGELRHRRRRSPRLRPSRPRSDQVNIAPEIAADGCAPRPTGHPRRRAPAPCAMARSLCRKDRETMRANALTTFLTRYDMRPTPQQRPSCSTKQTEQRQPPNRMADYRASDHISAEHLTTRRRPFVRPAFTFANRARRALWNTGWLLLFRPYAAPVARLAQPAAPPLRSDLGPDCHFYPPARLGPLEPHLRGPRRRRAGVEIYNPSPIQLDPTSSSRRNAYPLRRDARLQRPGVSSARLPMRRALRLGLRASLGGSGRQIGEGAVLRPRLRGHTRP